MSGPRFLAPTIATLTAALLCLPAAAAPPAGYQGNYSGFHANTFGGYHGNFNGFYTFLLQLEKLPRITRITNLTLQKLQDKDGEMQASMTLSIFFEADGNGSSFAGAQ